MCLHAAGTLVAKFGLNVKVGRAAGAGDAPVTVEEGDLQLALHDVAPTGQHPKLLQLELAFVESPVDPVGGFEVGVNRFAVGLLVLAVEDERQVAHGEVVRVHSQAGCASDQ